VKVDPYGPESKEYVVGPEFERMWTSGLAHCQKRFEGKRGLYRKAPSGGIGAFTPDSFPVFDAFRQNAYVICRFKPWLQDDRGRGTGGERADG